jgi:CRISPR/Cas system-associated endoribonuclease Cas2
LKKELSRIIKPKEDFISIIKMINEDNFAEDVLGTKPEDSDSLIL